MIRMDLSIQIPTHPALADTVVPEVLNQDIGTMGTRKIPIKQTQVSVEQHYNICLNLYLHQVHHPAGEQCLMRVPDTSTVSPEQGHGRMNLPDRNSTQVVPVDINMGKLFYDELLKQL